MDKTLDEMIDTEIAEWKEDGHTDVVSYLEALRTAIVQRNTWCAEANGAECAEAIAADDQAIVVLLRGEL